MTQEFASQKVSATQNKADKSTYSKKLFFVENTSMMTQKLGLSQVLHVSDFPTRTSRDYRGVRKYLS